MALKTQEAPFFLDFYVCLYLSGESCAKPCAKSVVTTVSCRMYTDNLCLLGALLATTQPRNHTRSLGGDLPLDIAYE